MKINDKHKSILDEIIVVEGKTNVIEYVLTTLAGVVMCHFPHCNTPAEVKGTLANGQNRYTLLDGLPTCRAHVEVARQIKNPKRNTHRAFRMHAVSKGYCEEWNNACPLTKLYTILTGKELVDPMDLWQYIPKEYIQADHIDGVHTHNTPENNSAKCIYCHQRKTRINEDYLKREDKIFRRLRTKALSW